jgi:predicted AlkP superfamily pyrophosphatase or phosphodiesterase
MALAVPGPAAGVAGGANAPPARPRLVLFVSVDQMRFDYLTRFAPLFESGLGRILDEGAVFTNARYRHANCETGPGHALLLSGRHARDNGIVANSWYDRLRRKSINVVEDPVVSPLPGPGRPASPANFIGFTVGDLLKKASPASRVVGVSLKDRSAILMAGPRADAAYWYEPKAGRFGSSTYYMPALPPWLEAWNREGKVDALRGALWTRLLSDEALYRRHAGPDDVRGEWDTLDTIFPHRIRGVPPSAEFYEDVRRTPFADELTLEAALLAAQNHDLGTDEATDVLAVGFSATDTIGHTYGPDSQELMDQILRLDRILGRLMAAMEARTGPGRLLVGLSGDHGVMPLVESLRAQGKDARRVHPDALEKPVRQALASRFPGAADLVADFDAGGFTLDLEALSRHGLKQASVETAIEDALLATGLVERVYTGSRLLGDPPADDPHFALFRASFFEPRSPHVAALLKPYVYMDHEYVGGTGHGSPYDYDRHVPVAFLGAGIRPGHHDAQIGPEDIAPTLARLLGLEYRLETGQRVLVEALAGDAAAAEIPARARPQAGATPAASPQGRHRSASCRSPTPPRLPATPAPRARAAGRSTSLR